jgi:protein-tyrosine phosphatase
MLERADLVLVATRGHLESAIRRVPSAMRRTFTIREAGRVARTFERRHVQSVSDLRSIVSALADARASLIAPADDDIIDPEGRGEEAYLQMITEEVPPLAELAHVAFGMPPADLDAYRAASADPAARLTEGFSRDEESDG